MTKYQYATQIYSRFNESVEEGDAEKHLMNGEAHHISQNLLGHTHYLQGG